MKNLLFLSLFVILFSCGKDSDCSKEQFLGTWTGSYSCETFGNGDVTVDITAGSGSNIVVNEESNISNPGFFSDVTLDQDGCGAENKQTVLGTGTTHSASLSSDGSKLTLSYVISAVGVVAERCTYTLEPK